MRLIGIPAIAALVAASAGMAEAQPPRPVRLYQGRRPAEQSDQLSRKIKLGRTGSVSISNVSGEITVTAGGGDEVSIEAVKRGRRGDFDRVRIVIDDRPGRVDVSTDYGTWRGAGNNVSVDYTVTVPADVALDVSSVSGQIKVDGVKGGMRLGSVSGNITSTNTPTVEYVRTVSGNVELSGVAHGGSLSLSSVSGGIRANGIKVRSLDINTVSGDVALLSASVDRVNSRAVSGSFEYSGTLGRNGRYEVNSHSGDVRFVLADNTGFELSAASFSGSVRSDIPGASTIDRSRGRGPRREELQSTVGDGSARLDLRTFSGSIVISRK